MRSKMKRCAGENSEACEWMPNNLCLNRCRNWNLFHHNKKNFPPVTLQLNCWSMGRCSSRVATPWTIPFFSLLQAEQMFSEIQGALYGRLDELEWIDEEVRRKAKVLVRAEGRSYRGLLLPDAFGEGMEGTCTFTYSYLLLLAQS